MNMIQAPAPQGNAQSMNRYAPAIRESFQNVFGGLNHTAACGDGEIYDMENICVREYPVLQPRKHRVPRGIWQPKRHWSGGGLPATVYYDGDPVDLIQADGYWTIERVRAVRDGELVETGSYALHHSANGELGTVDVNSGNNTNISVIEWHHDESLLKIWDEKRPWQEIDWTVCGKYIFVADGTVARNDVYGYYASLTDATNRIGNKERGTVVAVPIGEAHKNIDEPKAEEVWYDYYYWDGSWIALNRPPQPKRRVTYVSVTFSDGTYKDASAKANTMTCSDGFPDWIQVGDTLRVWCGELQENQGWHTVREISQDRKQLRFYENEWEKIQSTAVYVKLVLVPPDMDYVCSTGNRVFGCKKDSIYASALGDPYNWWTYDGLSTDAFSVDVGSPGDFTGCCEYNGDVFFFKEDCLYRLYMNGSNPARWQLIEYKYPGVMAGCSRSLVSAGGALYWMSKQGMMRFTGGWPTCIQQPIGTEQYTGAVCGSDTRRIFACLERMGEYTLYVLDTWYNLWTKHDHIECRRFAYAGRHLYAVAGVGEEGSGRVLGLDWDEDYGPPASREYDGDDTQLIEFGDMQLQSADHKLQERITVTASVEETGLLEVWYSHDGRGWGKAGEMKPGQKRAQTFSFPPHRNDFCRIRLKGRGNWKLWNVTTGKQVGTELG